MDDCRLCEGIHQGRGGARDEEGRGEGRGMKRGGVKGGERRVDNVLA